MKLQGRCRLARLASTGGGIVMYLIKHKREDHIHKFQTAHTVTANCSQSNFVV